MNNRNQFIMSRSQVAQAWALQARGITPAAWKVLMILAHRVNNRRNDFDVWPKQKTLADECDMPVSTLKRQLDELEGKRFIVRSMRYREDGGVAGCTYTLKVKANFELPNGTASYNFADEDDGDEDTPPSSKWATPPSPDLADPQPTGELPPQPTDGLAIEPKKKEPLKENLPPSAIAEPTPTTDSDLFGEALPVVVEEPLHDRVVSAWRELASEIPAISNIRLMDDARAKKIGARTGAAAKQLGITPWQVWEQVFAAIRRSSFLCGRAPPGKGYAKPMTLTIDYVLRPAEFQKILEGAYDDRPGSGPRTYDPDTGRSYGPSEQAGRAVLERRRAGRAQSRQPGHPGGSAGADQPRLSHHPR